MPYVGPLALAPIEIVTEPPEDVELCTLFESCAAGSTSPAAIAEIEPTAVALA
jgi:hypothetical protein